MSREGSIWGSFWEFFGIIFDMVLGIIFEAILGRSFEAKKEARWSLAGFAPGFWDAPGRDIGRGKPLPRGTGYLFFPADRKSHGGSRRPGQGPPGLYKRVVGCDWRICDG